MGWFSRDRSRDSAEQPEAGHEEPVEIDLGLQRSFEVEMEVERLKGAGLSVYLFAQREVPEFGGIGPMHCSLYVRPDDELQVRAELTSAGFL